MMTRPVRIQMQRKKGFNLQAESLRINGLPAVLVTRQSRWGNPFVVGRDGTREECIQKYIADLLPYTHQHPNNGLDKFYISEANLSDIRRHLSGKNLACFCPLHLSCHADFLLKMAQLTGE